MSLRTEQLRVIECDASGCDSRLVMRVGEDAVEARFEARERGWSYSTSSGRGKGAPQRFDYCPKHKLLAEVNS